MHEFLDELYNDKTIFSSDSTGIAGDPASNIAVGEKCLPDANIQLELIHYHWSMMSYLLNGRYPINRIAGFHGHTGDDRDFIADLRGKLPRNEKLKKIADQGKVFVANFCISPSEYIFNLAEHIGQEQNRSLYVLNHEPKARELKKRDLYKKRDRVFYAVENHPSEGSLDKTIAIVKELTEAGMNAFVVYDMVHEMRTMDSGKQYHEKWDEMIKGLKKVRDAVGQCLIHLPIGIYAEDSILFEFVVQSMLKDFADLNNAMMNPIVVENQIGGLTQARFNLLWKSNRITKALMHGLEYDTPESILKLTQDRIAMLVDNEVIKVEKSQSQQNAA